MNRFREALGTRFGLQPDEFARPGLTLIAEEDRRGSRRQSRWRVDRHDVVLCDPEFLDEVRRWGAVDVKSGGDIGDSFRRWAMGQGATILGCGVDHVIGDAALMPPRPMEVVVLEPHHSATIEAATKLLDACSEGDRDEADFDLDDLDEFLVGWLVDGELLALAGGRPFDAMDGIRDLGVMVHPANRQAGIGRAVVAAVVDAVQMAGCAPIYRCDVTNIGSMKLCRGLGFERLVDVEAFEWPERAESPSF